MGKKRIDATTIAYMSKEDLDKWREEQLDEWTAATPAELRDDQRKVFQIREEAVKLITKRNREQIYLQERKAEGAETEEIYRIQTQLEGLDESIDSLKESLKPLEESLTERRDAIEAAKYPESVRQIALDLRKECEAKVRAYRDQRLDPDYAGKGGSVAGCIFRCVRELQQAQAENDAEAVARLESELKSFQHKEKELREEQDQIAKGIAQIKAEYAIRLKKLETGAS